MLGRISRRGAALGVGLESLIAEGIARRGVGRGRFVGGLGLGRRAACVQGQQRDRDYPHRIGKRNRQSCYPNISGRLTMMKPAFAVNGQTAVPA